MADKEDTKTIASTVYVWMSGSIIKQISKFLVDYVLIFAQRE